MSKIYFAKCYLTRPQYEKIKQDAELQGFTTVANYMRSKITGSSLFIEQKIMENNKILKRLEKHLLKVKNGQNTYS
jgi:hypothetical protein